MLSVGRVAISFATLLFTSGLFVSAAVPSLADTVDDSGTAWVYGTKYSLATDSCGLKGMNQILQVKRDGKWATISKGIQRKSKAICAEYGKFAYVTTYRFTLEDLGNSVPEERYRLLEVREIWRAYGKPQSNVFTKQVYPNKEAQVQDFLDVLAG